MKIKILVTLGVVVVFFIIGALALLSEPEHVLDREIVVTNFEQCVAAGNPVMESYPRQCRHGDSLFVEEIDDPIVIPDGTDGDSTDVVTCDPSNRPEICTMEYAPVCGLVEVQCITTPCDPVPQTFSNGCSACGTQNVISYTSGACELE